MENSKNSINNIDDGVDDHIPSLFFLRVMVGTSNGR